MLIKLEVTDPRPDDFFLYAQNDTSLTMYGYTDDVNFNTYEVPEIVDAPQKCMPPEYGEYMTVAEIEAQLIQMLPTAIEELADEIEHLRKHITNGMFPYVGPDSNTYMVICSEGEHRDLLKGARRRAERDPEWTNNWIMVDPVTEEPVFIPLDNERLRTLANAFEEWGSYIFEQSVMMKMGIQSLRYEQVKNYVVEYSIFPPS